MARLELDGLDAAVEEMKRMGELTGEAANAMLMTGAAWIAQGIEKAAKREGHERSGDLIESIGYNASPKYVMDVPTIEIYARGKDSEGVSNMDKAFVNNYGTTKLDETLFWEEGEAEAELDAVRGMTQVWSEFVITGRVPQVSGPGKYRVKKKTS